MLLFVDMDDFKQINDAHGHQEGDVALQRAARVLRATFRDSDIVARLGGDEFVVLAADAGSSAWSFTACDKSSATATRTTAIRIICRSAWARRVRSGGSADNRGVAANGGRHAIRAETTPAPGARGRGLGAR